MAKRMTMMMMMMTAECTLVVGAVARRSIFPKSEARFGFPAENFEWEQSIKGPFVILLRGATVDEHTRHEVLAVVVEWLDGVGRRRRRRRIDAMCI
jgi:hypothetical protein